MWFIEEDVKGKESNLNDCEYSVFIGNDRCDDDDDNDVGGKELMKEFTPISADVIKCVEEWIKSLFISLLVWLLEYGVVVLSRPCKWVRWCVLQWSDLLNDFEHKLHLNGRKFKCFLKCLVNSSERANVFPHIGIVNELIGILPVILRG